MDADARTHSCIFDPDSVTSSHVDSGFGAFRILHTCFKHGVLKQSPVHLMLFRTLIVESRLGETRWHLSCMDENTGLTALDSVYYRTQHPLSSLS